MKHTILGGLAWFLAAAPYVHARGITYSGPSLRTRFGFNDVTSAIKSITNGFTIILFLVAVIFFIIAAFNYLSSQGSQEKVATAHKQIIYGLVALAVAIVAQGLVFFVQEIIG